MKKFLFLMIATITVANEACARQSMPNDEVHASKLPTTEKPSWPIMFNSLV